MSAALIIGVVWAGWHLPLFLTHKMPPPAAIVMVMGAVTMAWLYLNSGESALLLTAFHAIGNTVGGAWFFSLFAREDMMKVILLRLGERRMGCCRFERWLMTGLASRTPQQMD